MVTVAPTAPDAGLMPETVGAGALTVKVLEVAPPQSRAHVPVPLTEMAPVLAPAGTGTTICVLVTDEGVAMTLLANMTVVAPLTKLVPVMVTLVPTVPDAGLMLDTVEAVELPDSMNEQMPSPHCMTRWGIAACAFEPSPTAPELLLPQHHTLPSVLRASEVTTNPPFTLTLLGKFKDAL